jgi:hypothetical protein
MTPATTRTGRPEHGACRLGAVCRPARSLIGFASSTGGGTVTLGALAAGGSLAVLVGSLAWLAPIQRRLVGAALGGRRGVAGQLTTGSPASHRFALAVLATVA